MYTLKNFNRYWVITFVIQEYENWVLQTTNTSTQNIPYWEIPTLPADPSNPFEPWEPWTSVDKPTPVPVSWDATYIIKYYYSSETIIAYYSWDWTFHSTAPYVSRDPSWYLLLKNLGSVVSGCQQLCIEDTDFNVPTLNNINERFWANLKPWIMTAELEYYITQSWGDKVYCPWITSIEWWKIDGQAIDPSLFGQVNYGSWDNYSSSILTSVDMDIIRYTFMQTNMRYYNESIPVRFSDIQWRTWIFSSLFNYNQATPYIRYDQNQWYQSMTSSPVWWISADYSSRVCLTTDNTNLINERLKIQDNSSTSWEVQYWLIRLKDPSRCIYTN